MSSDSEDDFSYTNSANILRHLTKKLNNFNEKQIDTLAESVNTLTNNPIEDIIDIDSDKSNPVKSGKSKDIIKRNEINIDLCNKPTSPTNSEVILIDSEVEQSPLNIIAAIDSCLDSAKSKRGRKKGRGRGRKILPKQRRSKRINGTLTEDNITTIVIDPDIDIIDTSNNLNSDINYEEIVKVFWKSQYVKKFTIRRFEKLDVIFKFFSKEENITEDRLLFTINEKVVSKYDTPETLDINAATIIEGGTLSVKSHLGSGVQYPKGNINIKVQMKDRKKPIIVSMKATDQMSVLFYQCAEELQIQMWRLKFYFDGDLIKSTDSPSFLQLEDGECLDCVQI